MPLLDWFNQISKYTMCTWCGKPAGLFSHILFDIEGELCLRKFSVIKLKSASRPTNYRNTAFWLLEASTCVADVPSNLGCNEQTIYRLQTRFRQPGSKNDKPSPGRPGIMTPLEVGVMVTSIWRNRFMAAWELLKHLRYATGTRNSIYTARNRLRGAWLIWNLNFHIDLFM